MTLDARPIVDPVKDLSAGVLLLAGVQKSGTTELHGVMKAYFPWICTLDREGKVAKHALISDVQQHTSLTVIGVITLKIAPTLTSGYSKW